MVRRDLQQLDRSTVMRLAIGACLAKNRIVENFRQNTSQSPVNHFTARIRRNGAYKLVYLFLYTSNFTPGRFATQRI